MKIEVKEGYWSNRRLLRRYYETIDGKLHGLYESYYPDGSIWYIRYYDNGKVVKLENNYCDDKIEISYYL